MKSLNPPNWQTKKLGEVLQKTETINPLKEPTRDFVYIDFSSINRENLAIENTNTIKGKDAPSRARKLVRTGDIIFATIRPTLRRIAIIPNEFNEEVCSTGYFVLRPKQELENKLIFYFLQTDDFTVKMEKLQKGASYPAVTDNEVRSQLISFPESLPEQQRIVAILDEAFATIAKAKENAEKNLKNAREVFESYFLSVLNDKKWEWKTPGDVCDRVEYGSSTKSNTVGAVPVLRMGNIQNGRFAWDDLVYSDNTEDNKQYLLKYNDVLFNRTNSPELVGKTAIYKGEMPAIFAGYLIRLHRKESLLDADYLNYYLNSPVAKEYGKTVVISSVNQANINGTKLKTYPIPLPTLDEQKVIAAKLDTLSVETQKLDALYQQKLADLEELKKSLLQKAFAGELTKGVASRALATEDVTVTEALEVTDKRRCVHE